MNAHDFLYNLTTIVSTANMLIGVNPDRKSDWQNKECFYVFDNESYLQASKITKIHFREPAYYFNTTNNQKLDKTEINLLMSLFKEKSIHEQEYTNCLNSF